MFSIFCCILYFIICLNIVRSQGRSHLSLFAIFESKDWCVKWMERRRQQRLKRAAIINENRRNLGGKRTRTQYERNDPKDSPFWKYMTKETYRDPTHRDGKLFRRRFRMPFDMFLKIVNLVREKQWFPEKQSLRMQLERQEAIPLEIKLLGVFRVLGRGVCFDDIEELTHVSAETHRKFFRDFVTIFSLELYDIWIHGPRSDDEVLVLWLKTLLQDIPDCLAVLIAFILLGIKRLPFFAISIKVKKDIRLGRLRLQSTIGVGLWQQRKVFMALIMIKQLYAMIHLFVIYTRKRFMPIMNLCYMTNSAFQQPIVDFI